MIVAVVMLQYILIQIIIPQDRNKEYSGKSVLLGVLLTILLWGSYFWYLYFIESEYW